MIVWIYQQCKYKIKKNKKLTVFLFSWFQQKVCLKQGLIKNVAVGWTDLLLITF